MSEWKRVGTVIAPFLEIGDSILLDDIVYTITDIAEDEVGYRITARDHDWEELHEFVIGDDDRIILVTAE